MRFDGTSEVVAGELGLGGASFMAAHRPVDDALTLEVRLGNALHVIPAMVSSVRAARTATRHVQVKFDELGTKTELALAKWLDGVVE